MGPGEPTREHYVPQWAFSLIPEPERRHQIDQFSDRTEYSKSFVPCCRNCNNVHLNQLEAVARRVLLEGERNLTDEDKQNLIAWGAKVWLGAMLHTTENRHHGHLVSENLESIRDTVTSVRAILRQRLSDDDHDSVELRRGSLVIVDMVQEPAESPFYYVASEMPLVTFRIRGTGVLIAPGDLRSVEGSMRVNENLRSAIRMQPLNVAHLIEMHAICRFIVSQSWPDSHQEFDDDEAYWQAFQASRIDAIERLTGEVISSTETCLWDEMTASEIQAGRANAAIMARQERPRVVKIVSDGRALVTMGAAPVEQHLVLPNAIPYMGAYTASAVEQENRLLHGNWGCHPAQLLTRD